MPAFSETFRVGDTVSTHSLQSCRGKVLLLYFWRASTPGLAAFVETVARDPKASLDQAVKDYPVLEGEIVLLGVNVDRDARAFEDAVARWHVPWPQHHDGKGFETPLAELLAIPRTPHWVAVDPAGRIWYLGADVEQFYAHASELMRRHRIALEKGERPGRSRRDER
jgi:hypothetical protein